MMITLKTDTGNTIKVDHRLFEAFVESRWDQLGSRIKAAKAVVSQYGLQYRSAQKVVKTVLG